MNNIPLNIDWGSKSEIFDKIKKFVGKKNLSNASEAQIRHDVIDRMIHEVLGWEYGQVSVEEVEEKETSERKGFVDYIIRSGDITIVLETKKAGITFPSPTKKRILKLSGSVLKSKEVLKAINQANSYANSKNAQLTIVSNGRCWCFFLNELFLIDSDTKAHLFFPFDKTADAEALYNHFSCEAITKRGLTLFLPEKILTAEKRLSTFLNDSGTRINRNNIADWITPALNNAFHTEALLNDAEVLKYCFVTTDTRTKYDKTLGMHIADNKPSNLISTTRIRKDKKENPLKKIINLSEPSKAPPVTLVLGSVGSGKSTYLKHFELISGNKIISKKNSHWISIDFYSMGKGGNPRNFIYQSLLNYLLKETDYKNAVEPAYHDLIEGLIAGPYAPIANNKDKLDESIFEYIENDFKLIEPYVDKVLGYLAKLKLCIIVLDNGDLNEDEELETQIFSEGLALSKRLLCNVIVSMRDTTFVKHKDDSSFDAFEFRKLWLDPPPFKSVLSKRLSYSKRLLSNKKAKIPLPGNAILEVQDLSIFFDIVQSSILKGKNGDFIEYIADQNIRKGLTLITNFLTSGHIHADTAIKNYMLEKSGSNERKYQFPFHEVFKGSILGQWKYYSEARAECINIFDSRLGSENLKLLRFLILNYLYLNSKNEASNITSSNCVKLFSKLGVNDQAILDVLNLLYKKQFIKPQDAKEITINSIINITSLGAYCTRYLSKSFVYVESCLYDTSIENKRVWDELNNLTVQIEHEGDRIERMILRKERVLSYLGYLISLENKHINLLNNYESLTYFEDISKCVNQEINSAINNMKNRRSTYKKDYSVYHDK